MSRLRTAALAVGAALATELVFDVGFSVARGGALAVGYFALCAGLMLAGGAICAAIGSWLPGPPARNALILFALAHAVAGTQPLPLRLLAFSAIVLAIWLFLSPRRRYAPGPAASGILVASAICVAMVLRPYIGQVLGLSESPLWQGPSLPLLALLVLAAAALWEEIRTLAPRLVPGAWLALAGLAIALLAADVAVDRTRTYSASPVGGAQAAVRRPTVILLVLDTVRADHMSVYGYQRDTTPNLSRFLADHPNAVRYEYAFSPASWTVPSHASLLTGLLPSQHRASGQGVAAAVDSALYTIPLAADITLAEVMHEAGYCTAAVLANANLLRTDGLERGFEAYFQPSGVRRLRLLGERLRRALIPAAYAGIKPFPLGDLISENVLRLRSECEPRPGFLVVNYMDAHSPYLAPPPHANLFAGTGVPQRPLLDPVLSDPPELIALKRDRYDEAIHHLDAELGRLFSALDRAGGMEDSWLFITSDHGNAFREHGTMAHGSSIYNEQVRIPLLVKPPAGIRLDAASGPVSLVDVATTVAAIGGRQGFGVGRDLSGPPDPHHSVWLQFGGRARSGPELGESSEYPARGVIQGRWKLIERSGSEEELYDVVDDPEERLNRSSEHADLRRRLEAALPPPLDGQDDETASPGQRLGLDDEEQLRALGYLR